MSASPPNPWRDALGAVRSNLLPGVLLQVFATLLLGAYFFHAPSRAALEQAARLRTEFGLAWDMATTAVFGAIIPFAFLRLRRATRDRYSWSQMAVLTAFWAYKGLEVSFWYDLQARFFGTDSGFSTVAAKTFVDQFVYCPFFAVPVTWALYAWVENRFSFAPVLAEMRRPGWYSRHAMPLLATTWCLWIPAVVVIYLMPVPLQLPVQNLVQCFFTLLLVFLTRPRSGR